MEKVILAILTIASSEKTTADLTFSAAGGHMTTTGALELRSNEPLNLTVWRGGDKSELTLSPDDNLSVNQSEGKYEIAIGGICISFHKPFTKDPFSVAA